MAFEFPEPIKLDKRLKDMLDDVVEEKYYLTDEQTERLRATTYNSGKEEIRVQNTNGESRTLCARDWKDPKCVRVGGLYDKPGSRQTDNFIKVNNDVSRQYSDESVKRIKQNIIKGDVANTLTANAMQSITHNNCGLIIEEGKDNSCN